VVNHKFSTTNYLLLTYEIEVIGIFTGIIEEIGIIQRITRGSKSFQLDVRAHKVLEDVKIGDSIAVSGVCLTVVKHDDKHFVADVMPETLDKTILKYLTTGSNVNLERALKLDDRMGGHIVQGHVDGLGIIIQKNKLDNSVIYRIKAPDTVLKYTVAKGSVAVDGISLTVVDVFSDSFTVSLIPHTAHLTTLGIKGPGDMVNLESDIIGRYVEKLLKAGEDKKSDGMTTGFLAEHGFI
jgi:riboflavin synthase